MKTSFYSNISLGPLWCLGAAFFLSLGWLLPNNVGPVNAFHADAWVAGVLLLVSLVVLFKGPAVVSLQGLPLLIVATSLLPLVQYAVGVLPFQGQALIAMAYLLGFALAVVTGQQWQRLNPLWMERILFTAFLFAGVVSVFIALYQWLRLGESAGMTDIWVLDYARERGRPYANLGQPNQLATLLVWALVACAWAAYRGHVRVLGGVVIAATLIVGLALTQSRSGMISVIVGLMACWKWRHLVSGRTFAWCVVGLTVWYVLLLAILPHVGQLLLLETEVSFIERSVKEKRPYMWQMLLDAATHKPWTGYGWNQIMTAQLEVSEIYTKLAGSYIAQSHNLFLDFVVWAGFPVGLLLCGVVLAWCWTAFRKVKDVNQALYVTLLAVIGAHAMLELPLHYAYFLLPAGLVLGSLNASMQIWVFGTVHRGFVLALWSLSAVFLALVLNDYFRLEGAYTDVRFKHANFVNAPEPQIHEAVVLEQLQHAIELYALTPAAGMTDEEVQRAVDTTVFMPWAYNISKLVVVLALNNRAGDAGYWMGKARFTMNPEDYANAQKDWKRAAQKYPEMAKILEPQK